MSTGTLFLWHKYEPLAKQFMLLKFDGNHLRSRCEKLGAMRSTSLRHGIRRCLHKPSTQCDRMIHTARDLQDASIDSYFEGEKLIIFVPQPETRVPIVAPHVQILLIVDRGRVCNPTGNRCDACVGGELVPSEQRGGNQCRFRLMLYIRAKTKYSVAPRKHVSIICKSKRKRSQRKRFHGDSFVGLFLTIQRKTVRSSCCNVDQFSAMLRER